MTQTACENTVGEIARRADRPVHKVEYVIRARGIKPEGVAGAYRLFSEESVVAIIAELQRIDARRAAQ